MDGALPGDYRLWGTSFGILQPLKTRVGNIFIAML